MNTQVFAALGDPTRAEIVARLGRQGPASIKRLAQSLPISRQAVTKHLGALEQSGLVTARKKGREQIYELQTKPLHDASEWLDALASQWDHRLAALKSLLENPPP